MTVDCWRLFTLATCFYKIISHHLIAHEMQRDAENAFRRKVPFVSVRFADTLGIARSSWTFISLLIVVESTVFFAGKKKRQSITFQRSGPFLAVPDDQEMLVSSDPCVFEDSRFRILLRFAVLSFCRQNCPVDFQTDSSDFFRAFGTLLWKRRVFDGP